MAMALWDFVSSLPSYPLSSWLQWGAVALLATLVYDLLLSFIIFKRINRAAVLAKPGEKEAMRSLDVLWLYLDSPSNPTVINGLMFLPGGVERQRLLEHYERVLAAEPHYRRFKQRPLVADLAPKSMWRYLLNPSTWFRLPGINTPQWVYDRNFSVANHITEVDIWDYYRTHIDHDFEIPQQQQQQEGDGISKQLEARVLRAVISHLVSFQLPFDRALWHTHILRLRHTHSPRSEPDADTERASTVLLCRIHHTIGDGISLIRYTLSTCAAVKPSSAEAESASSSLSKGQQQQQQQPPRATTGVTLTFMQVFMTVLTAPFVGMALLLQRPDSVSFLRRPNKDAGNTRPRVTTWVCPSFPLQSIKAIAAQHKATVNDVMVAIIARAIRLHADKVAADNPSVKELQHIRPIKAFVPVGSAFASEHDKELKNSFGFLFVRLPVDASSALRCLALAKREMDALKRSTLPLLTFISSAVSGAILAPIWLVLGTSYYTSLASLVFSNVKGPEHPIELAGYHVEDMTFLVPQAGGIGFGTSILSYNGQVSIGLNAVSSVFPIEGQEEGFAHRCRLAYMELLRASNEQ